MIRDRFGNRWQSLFSASGKPNVHSWMSVSAAAYWALGWKWQISPQMSLLSAAVGCVASLSYGGNYSFHLFPNVKNVCRPLCYQATWTLDVQICWHNWVAALRMAFVDYFITCPNKHPEGGLDLWSVTETSVFHLPPLLCSDKSKNVLCLESNFHQKIARSSGNLCFFWVQIGILRVMHIWLYLSK